MADGAKVASDYTDAQSDRVRALCLYVATKLGDLMDDLVVVGGLVPSLLVDQARRPPGVDAHVGTMDLDVGLKLALLDGGRYRTLTERLRAAGFSTDTNAGGKQTRQRWKLTESEPVTVDFLIEPSRSGDKGGKLRHIEPDFAAVIAPGIALAFRDQVQVLLEGRTSLGAKASRTVRVCGAGAYVVLKALAFDGRGENKDAYDLFYVVRNYGAGIGDVVARLRPLLDVPDAQRALDVLRRDFLDPDGLGPRGVAAFYSGGTDPGLQSDVVGFVGQLLQGCGAHSA